MRPGGRAAAWLAYAALAALGLAGVLAGGGVLAFRDLADYAIPHKLWAASEIRAGRVPLWNPYAFFGFPHLANLQSGVLYPPNLLLLAPFPLGVHLSLAVHFVIAAAGARALAGRLGSAPGASWIAGAAYGFSPYLVSLLDLNAFLATAAWLPWLLVAGHDLGRDPGPRRIAAAAAAFALGFLAGEPQTLALGAGGAFLLSLSGPHRRLRALLRLVASWTAAAVVTLLLVAPALLPFLELARLSERAGAGLGREEVFRYSLELPALATLVLPGFAGDVVDGSHWLGGQTYVRSPYLGVATLVLAWAGLAVRGGRLVLAVPALAGLALALGPSGGLYPLLYAAGLRQSRFPVKFLILTVLAVAVLAGRGAGRLWGEAAAAARSRSLLAAALVSAAAAAAFLLAPAAPARRGALHALLAAGGTGVVLIWAGRRPGAAAPRGALAAVLLADLAVASRRLPVTVPVGALLAPAPALAGLRLTAEGQPGLPWPRVYTPPISARTLAAVYAGGRFDAAAVERKKALLFGNTNLLFGIPVVRAGESMEVRRTAEFLALLDRGPVAAPLLDLAGVGYLVLSGEEGAARVIANPRALPHAFLVGRTRIAAGGAALEALARPGFEPAREAVVETDLGTLAPDCHAGRAEVAASTAREVRVRVDSPGRCLLVLTDAHYPGWEARAEGRPLAIHRADHAFRGVVVDGGVHEVTFRYRAPTFHHGLRLAAAGIAAWLALAIAAVGRLRKAGAPAAGGRLP